MKTKMLMIYVSLIALTLGLAVSPVMAGSEDFSDFGAIGELFTTLFIVFLPIILILFVIDLFLTKVLGYQGIFSRVFKL